MNTFITNVAKEPSKMTDDSDTHTHTPTVYAITPTYRRSSQRPDLTTLCQTLMHVDNLHWIVVEDAANASEWIEELLIRSGLKYTHLSAIKSQKERDQPVRTG